MQRNGGAAEEERSGSGATILEFQLCLCCVTLGELLHSLDHDYYQVL